MLFSLKERGQGWIEFLFGLVFLAIIFYMLMITFRPDIAIKMRFW